MIRFFCLCLLLVVFSCGSDSPSTSGTKTKGLKQDEGTAKMIAILSEAHANIDPTKVSYHLNSVKAESYKAQLGQDLNLNDKLAAKGKYANELLLAGKTHEAIIEIE